MRWDWSHTLRTLLWQFGHWFVAWPWGRLLCDYQIRGAEHVPLRGGVLVAANHVSYFDPPLLGTGTSRVMYYMARAELFRNALFAGFIRAWGAFPIGRSTSSVGGLKEAFRKLRQGRLVLFFPEGTRSYDGKLAAPMPGAGLLVLRAAAPVVPAHIEGTFKFFPRGAKGIRLAKVTVSYGPPLDLSRFDGCEPTKEVYREAAAEVMHAIAALYDALPPNRREN